MEGGSGGGYLYVLPILQCGFHTEFKVDAHFGWFGGICPVKIMILEVIFLLTNLDSTSSIFITLYLALNK